MTGDRWHVTCDMWHMTPDMWGKVNLLSKFNLPISYVFGMKEKKGWVSDWIKESVSDKSVYRTAPASPGLLIILVFSP